MAIGSASPLLLSSASAATDDSDPVTRSLRWDGGTATRLYNSSISSSETSWTISMWVKRGKLTSSYSLFSLNGANQMLHFDNNDQLAWHHSGSDTRTDSKFRDASAWLHITVTNTSGAIRLYVNGTQDTTGGFSSNPTGTSVGTIYIGAWNRYGTSPTYEFDGHIADVYFVDGEVKSPTDFIESNDYGGYKPKAYTGSFGTNGFHLKFDDSSDIGADSANSNDFTVTNLASTDIMLDTPTTNYSTLSPIDGGSYQLKEGNLGATGNSSAGRVRSTMGFNSGKWYWEFYLKAYSNGGGYGIAKLNSPLSSSTGDLGHDSNSWGVLTNNGTTKHNNSTGSSSGSAGTGDLLMCALDMDNGKVFFGKNGSWLDSGNPATGANPYWSSLSGTIGAALGMGSGSAQDWVFNFGQDPTFAGNKTSGQDTSQSEFYYAPPSGFKSLSTGNFDDPTVKAHENFGVLTYTGNDTDNTSITGLDFQPNFTWIKQRSNSSTSHFLHDSERTQGSPTSLWNYLKSNSNSAESWDSDQFDGFLTNGFKISSNGNSDDINKSSRTYVAWNWKENASAGFDIVTWTGANVTAGSYATVSHSLGVVPEMVIAKPRTNLGQQMGYHPDWIVHHVDLGTGGSGYKKFLRLDSNGAALEAGNEGTAGLIDSLTTTNFRAYNEGSSSASYYMNWGYEGNDEDYIAYLFASVDGVCKVGSYTGNASSDGPTIYCGFRPAFLLMKNANASGSHWFLVDSKRDPDNKVHTILEAETSDADNVLSAEFVDFLSTGFKVRNNGSYENGSGNKIIFLAMAESPLKYANAR